MHSRGYWLAEYLPISRLIRKAPGRYERAFLETETDGGDTTYFLIHQLQMIERAIDDLHIYLQRKIAEQHDAEARLAGFDGLNGRQVALLTPRDPSTPSISTRTTVTRPTIGSPTRPPARTWPTSQSADCWSNDPAAGPIDTSRQPTFPTD